jgi:hypothetical protein
MPGPRVYTVEEVDELIPKVERIFVKMDGIKERLRVLHIRINALEMIWGSKVQEKSNPDHGEFDHHVGEMKAAEEEFERCQKMIAKLGGQVKGLDPALVDFYGVRDGRLVFWCWTRGETKIDHWHHVDEGFASRQKV